MAADRAGAIPGAAGWEGRGITLVDRLDELAPRLAEVANEELRRRYLTARVEEIHHIRTEFGVTYWQVRTDKGERDFVVQSLSESCIWLSDRHLLLVDVDGNRFEIADRAGLDPPAGRLDAVL